MFLGSIINSVACYMFRPPVVAIFREVFLEGILHKALKHFASLKCEILGKRYCFCNKSQQDAPFLKFLLVKNSTCFGQTYSPSSRVSTLHTQFVILVTLTVC